MLTPEQLAEIEARADAAIDGPWGVKSNEPGAKMHGAQRLGGPGGGAFLFLAPVNDNEAAFIAHSRTDIPALLAHIREQDARIGAVAALCERVPTTSKIEADPWSYDAVFQRGLLRAYLTVKRALDGTS